MCRARAKPRCRLQFLHRTIRFLSRNGIGPQEFLGPFVDPLGEGQAGACHLHLGSGRLDLRGTRPVDQPLVVGRQLGHASLGLGDFFRSESGGQLGVLRLARVEVRPGFCLAGLKIKGFQFDEDLARCDGLALLDEDFGHSTADPRSESNLMGFEKSRNRHRFGSPLAGYQQRADY